MSKLLLVAKHEYRKNVRRRGFVLGTLGIPLLIVAIMAISILLALGGENRSPLGYVDETSLLSVAPRDQAQDDIELRAFPNEATARAALEAKEIQGFYVVPTDYLDTRKVILYYWDDRPGSTAREQFDAFLRSSLVAGLPEDVQQRILNGFELTLRSADGQRQIRSDEGINLLDRKSVV